MIYQLGLIAAGAIAIVAVGTSKSIRGQRSLVLSGLKYQITHYGNDTVEVVREDGLRFTLDAKEGPPTLKVGTRAQLEDALNQLRGKLVDDVPPRSQS